MPAEHPWWKDILQIFRLRICVIARILVLHELHDLASCFQFRYPETDLHHKDYPFTHGGSCSVTNGHGYASRRTEQADA
jgi:hypothetical protein